MTRQCPNDSAPLRSKGNKQVSLEPIVSFQANMLLLRYSSYGASYGDEAGAGYGGGGDDRGCFNCGEPGYVSCTPVWLLR